MKNRLIFVLCLIIISSVMPGCAKRTEKEHTVPVEAVKVNRGNISVEIFYVGDVKAQHQIKVYPKVTGKLIENIVKEQDRVKKDDVIAYIDRDEVGFEFNKAPVESPIDGIIGNMYLDKGESVTPNIAVAQVVDMDVVKVRINVVEKDLPKIKEGQLAEIIVDAYPDEVFKGTVERVSPVVDLNSRTALVEIEIPNPEHILKSGMFARTRIVVLEHKEVPCILRDAIIREDSKTYCFIIKDDKAYKTKITIGISEDDKIEIIDGIQEGDSVVITGQQGLKDGQAVEIVSKGAQE